MANVTESPERATRRPDAPVRGSPGERPGGRATPARRETRRAPSRRLLLGAVAAAAVVHLLLLWAVRVPMSPLLQPEAEVRAILEPAVPARPEAGAPPEAPSESAEEPLRETVETIPSRSPVVEPSVVPIARPRPSDRAPDIRTIPPTTLAARLADLPGAGVPEEPSIGLAGGGLTVPVPWGGFVPEDRKDSVWREERCSGKDADGADKPGEGEARDSQCD